MSTVRALQRRASGTWPPAERLARIDISKGGTGSTHGGLYISQTEWQAPCIMAQQHPEPGFFANALAKNNVDCLVILWLENFAMVSIAAQKGMSRRSIFLFVEIRGLRPLIGLVSPGTERHGAVH
jgi:hypothetical protein